MATVILLSQMPGDIHFYKEQRAQIRNSTDVNFSRILDGFSFSFLLQAAAFREASLSETPAKC